MNSIFARTTAAAALLMIALPGAALAEGGYAAPAPGPVVVADEAHDWTGFYIGGSVGLTYSFENLEQPANVVVVSGGEPELDGFAPGAFAGYLHQFGDYVLGGEMGVRIINTVAEPTGQIMVMTPQQVQLTETYLRARAGYAFDDLLLSGFFGLTSTAVQVNSGRLVNPNQSNNGITFGLGVDYAVTDQIIVGAEYLRTQTTVESGAGDFVNAQDMFQIRFAFQF